MGKPAVSVLVPIYNVDRYLRQCVASICAQTVRDIEIILIDDGSTDGCAAIADEFARADNRVRVMHKLNSGYGDSLNRGLTLANGEWISIIEPDDWIEPTMFEHLLAATREHGAAPVTNTAREHDAVQGPNAIDIPGAAHSCKPTGTRIDIVKGAYERVIGEPGKPSRKEPCAHLDLVNPPGQPFSIDECPALLKLHPSIWSALYRRAFLDEFGICFRPIPGAGWADNPFFVETMVAARAIVWLAEPVYHYREFEDGTISHLRDWHIIVERWNEMNGVLRRYDVEVPALLEAHACRGCAYLQMLLHDFDQRDPVLKAAIRAMASSIDAALVRRSALIPDEYKIAYVRARLPFGKPARAASSRASVQRKPHDGRRLPLPQARASQKEHEQSEND